MMLAFNKYRHLCTKEKWLSKSYEEKNIMVILAEMDNMKDTNPIFQSSSNPKIHKMERSTSKLIKKGARKTPKNNNDNKYAWKKFPPKKVKGRRK